jgi:multidrug efflux system membrane fusion protein
MKMNLKKLGEYRSWLVSAGIVVAITVWLATGSNTEEPRTLAADRSDTGSGTGQFSVRVRHQVAEEIVRTITVNGKTAPARIVEINAETDGRVIETGVDRGERVSQGAVIVRLDERDRAARLAQARATVRQREVEFEGRQRLKGESYVSEAQLQEAAALLEAARAEQKRAELDIEYTYIAAPFDGALQERHVEIGDFVKVGDPVATFVDDRSIIVSAAVSEYDARYVTRGEEAEARLATGETVSGLIRYVAPVADDATRTFTVELVVDNPNGALRAGMSAELMIPAERVFAHEISPSLLTLDDEGNVGVKIVNDEGLVEFYPADIALSTSEGVYVAGLPAAATIITVGQGFVNAGSYVESVPEDSVDSAVAIKTEERSKR